MTYLGDPSATTSGNTLVLHYDARYAATNYVLVPIKSVPKKRKVKKVKKTKSSYGRVVEP